jgi:hypothetical protein
VTEASAEAGVWVVVHMYQPGKEECIRLNQCMDVCAGKFKAVKWVKIISSQAIPNYPDAKCPTVLLYTKGDMVDQIVGPGLFGGHRMTPESLEYGLSAFGVLKTEIDESPLLNTKTTTYKPKKGQGKHIDNKDSDSDSDSDFR